MYGNPPRSCDGHRAVTLHFVRERKHTVSWSVGQLCSQVWTQKNSSLVFPVLLLYYLPTPRYCSTCGPHRNTPRGYSVFPLLALEHAVGRHGTSVWGTTYVQAFTGLKHEVWVDGRQWGRDALHFMDASSVRMTVSGCCQFIMLHAS